MQTILNSPRGFLLLSWACDLPSELQTAVLEWHRHTHSVVLRVQSLSKVPTKHPFPLSLVLNSHSHVLRLNPIYRQVLDVLVCVPVTLLVDR